MMTSPPLHETGLAINTVSSVNICLVVIFSNPPRSSKGSSHPRKVFWYFNHRLPNGVHRVIFFRLFTKYYQTKYHQNHLHRLPNFDVPPRSAHVRTHPIFLPNFLCTFFQVTLQVNQNSLCIPRAFTRF